MKFLAYDTNMLAIKLAIVKKRTRMFYFYFIFLSNVLCNVIQKCLTETCTGSLLYRWCNRQMALVIFASDCRHVLWYNHISNMNHKVGKIIHVYACFRCMSKYYNIIAPLQQTIGVKLKAGLSDVERIPFICIQRHDASRYSLLTRTSIIRCWK